MNTTKSSATCDMSPASSSPTDTTTRAEAADGSLERALGRGFDTLVRGHAFAARSSGARDLTLGERVRLVREVDNPADAFAVAVWTTGREPWRAGYLDRSVGARLAPWLDAGHAVDGRVRGWTTEPDGRWLRPVIRLCATVESYRRVASAAGARAAGAEPGVVAAESSGSFHLRRAGRTLRGRPPGSDRRVIV